MTPEVLKIAEEIKRRDQLYENLKSVETIPEDIQIMEFIQSELRQLLQWIESEK